MSNKAVGRPAMDPDEKRKLRSFKATDDEWRQIQERAEKAGLSTSAYIRKRALGK